MKKKYFTALFTFGLSFCSLGQLESYVVWDTPITNTYGFDNPNPSCAIPGSVYQGGRVFGIALNYDSTRVLNVGQGSAGTGNGGAFLEKIIQSSNAVNYEGLIYGEALGAGCQLNDVIATAPNEYLSCGYFDQTTKFGNGCYFISKSPIGKLDICIVRKQEDLNTPISVLTIGGANASCAPFKMEKDNAGNIYIVGYVAYNTSPTYSGNVDFNPGAGVVNIYHSGGANSGYVFLLKLDASGNFIFVKKLSDTISTDLGLAIDDNQNIYVTRKFLGTIDVDPDPVAVNNKTSYGGSDGLLVKYNSTGGFLWARQFGGTGNDMFPFVAVQNNSVVLTGNIVGTVSVDTESAPISLAGGGVNDDIFIQKLDQNGNHQFIKRVTYASGCRPWDIKLDLANNIYLFGRFIGTSTFSVDSYQITGQGAWDSFLLITNSTGIAGYLKGFGGASSDFPGGFEVDKTNGDVFLAHTGTGVVKVSRCQSIPLSVSASGPLSFCQGGSTTFNATTAAGSTYQWKNNGVNIAGATAASYAATTSGSYTVMVTNTSGCTSTSPASIVTANIAPSATITASGVTSFCLGSNVVLSANTGTGFTYQWKANGTNISGATSANYTAVTSGSYTVVVTNNTSCSATSAATVVTANPFTTPTFTQVPAICAGVTLNSLPTTSNNSIAGIWSPALNNATTTLYTFTPSSTVAPTCAASTTMTIAVNALPTATITSGGVATVCQGSSVVLNANTGTGFSYQWKNNGVNIPGATSASYSATASGPYSVQVTNSNNCSATSLATSVTVNPLTTPTFTQVAPICLGATLNALPTTSNNSIAGIWSPSLNNTATTNYTFTPTSTASPTCATNATMSITVNTLPGATITASGSTSICQGGTLTLNANTGLGLNYQWKNNGTNIAGATTSNYVASAAGSYTVQVTNSNNCSSTSSSTGVTVNPLTTPTFTQVDPICYGGGLSALPTVSDNSINGTWSPSVDNTSTTNYTFVPTSTSSPTCATSASMTIVVNELPIAIINNGTSATICEGDFIMLDATVGSGYTYQWQNNGIDVLDATTNSLTITTAGDYNVNVTDNNNCSNTSLIMTLVVNSLPTIDAGADQTICEGEVVTLNGSGADVLSWNNDVTDGISFIPLATATYSLVGTNNITGCSNTDEVIIAVNTLPIVSLLPFNDFCDTAGIIQLTGGNPAGGDFNGLGISSNSFNTGLGAGTYLVNYTYTDANGCSADASENLTVIHCSAAGIEEAEKIQLIIYPNPTIDNFTMNVSNDLLGKNYVIADFSGRVIAQGKINSLFQIVNMQGVSNGSYLLQIDQPITQAIKLIKQ